MNNDELRIRSGKARLLRSVIQGCRLNDLILLGEEIVGHPFVLSTVNHFVWYASHNMPRNPAIPQTGAATIPTQLFYEEDLGVFLEENASPYLVRARDDYYYCFCAMRMGSKLRGYSVMVCHKPFSESDKALHKAVCDILVGEMEKQEAVKRVLMLSAEENLLMHILEDPSYSYEHCEIEEIFPEGTRYVEVIAIRCLAEGGLAPDIGVIDALRELLGCDICFGYQGGLVSFAPMGTANQKRALLTDFVCKRGMMAGVSYPFNWLGNLHVYYRQASEAVSYCRKLGKQLLFFSEIVFFDLLNGISDTCGLTTMCNPDINRLQAYDQLHSTSYCPTLKVYIAAGMNAVEAARQLGIHRNSVLSRINKIMAILGEGDAQGMDGLFSLLIWEWNSMSGK